MVKYVYVQIGKTLEFKRFESSKQPTGWIRLDYLRKKLKENKPFKSKFTISELKQIKDYK